MAIECRSSIQALEDGMKKHLTDRFEVLGWSTIFKPELSITPSAIEWNK